MTIKSTDFLKLFPGITFVVLACGLSTAQHPLRNTSEGKSLTVAISLPNAQTNGVAIAGKRTFLVIPKQKGQKIPEIAEYVAGKLQPYPDETWNAWREGDDASRAFVHANSVHFGPDRTLWVVDFGSTELGSSIVKHGPKLVGINIDTGHVVEIMYFDSLLHPESALDDVRFNVSMHT
jgi:hypothetical protein